MELNRYLERSVARHATLTERFFYRAERRVHDLAEELGVDRNTVIADVGALKSLLDPFIDQYERHRGTVLVRFARSVTLPELIQHVYGTSNLLQLSHAYLTHTVDVAAFAERRGLSVSAAYALNRRVTDLMRAMGGTITHRRLEADELTLRFIAILVRTALGVRPTVLEAHLDAVNHVIARFEHRYELSLTDLDRTFMSAALGLALERGRFALNEDFLAVVAQIPMQTFFEHEAIIDGRALPHQETLFVSAIAACVMANSQIDPAHELARWIEADPAFDDIARRMEERFGPRPCATDLFGASLRRLYLFIRLGVAPTAFTQNRPVPDAYRDVLDSCQGIVDAWCASIGARGGNSNTDLVSQFALQVMPLIDRGPAPKPFTCVIVTLSELNRLTISTGIERDFPGTARVMERALPSVQKAEAALSADAEAGAAGMRIIVVDQEYADTGAAPAGAYPVVGTSVVEAGLELPTRIRQVLEASNGIR